MHRRPVHRWIAALALVAALGAMGARPAAAADLSSITAGAWFDHIWSALTEKPATLWERLSGWIGATEKSATQAPAPPPTADAGWSLDPNGGS